MGGTTMKKKFTNFVVLMLVAVLLICNFTVSVNAYSVKKSTAKPYTDVTRKKVDAKTLEAVTYLKKHGAFKDVVKGKKFYPNKVITRQEFILILGNLYGDDKVPVTAEDVRFKKTSTNVEGHRLIKLTRALGNPVSWPVSRHTPRFTRALAAKMIYDFTQLDQHFLPRR